MKSYSDYIKNNIKIYPIKEAYIFPNVQYGNLQVTESLRFYPGEVWYDDKGLVRLFSIKYTDGNVGNYFLFPKSSPMGFVYEILNSDIISFGLKLLGESIIHGSSIVTSIGQYLFKKASDGAEATISNFLEDLNTSNLGYVELISKEIVFNHLITMKMGIPVRLLEFVIKNPNSVDLKYETSRDRIQWKPYNLKSDESDKFYFMNAQTHGYFRIKTEQSDCQIYEIKAPNVYSINWNEQKFCWDLFLC